MRRLHRQQPPPHLSSGGGSVLLRGFSHFCVLSSSRDLWGGFQAGPQCKLGQIKKNSVCHSCPNGEMWVKEDRSLRDLCPRGGRKVQKREGREGEREGRGNIGVFQTLHCLGSLRAGPGWG